MFQGSTIILKTNGLDAASRSDVGAASNPAIIPPLTSSN